jgi:hypothetical protein
MKTRLTESDLEQYCDLDYYDTFAIVAEMRRQGGNEIAGVGRYVRRNTLSDAAEVAFVVEDSEQGKCIALSFNWSGGYIARQGQQICCRALNENVIMKDIFANIDLFAPENRCQQ